MAYYDSLRQAIQKDAKELAEHAVPVVPDTLGIRRVEDIYRKNYLEEKKKEETPEEKAAREARVAAYAAKGGATTGKVTPKPPKPDLSNPLNKEAAEAAKKAQSNAEKIMAWKKEHGGKKVAAPVGKLKINPDTGESEGLFEKPNPHNDAFLKQKLRFNDKLASAQTLSHLAKKGVIGHEHALTAAQDAEREHTKTGLAFDKAHAHATHSGDKLALQKLHHGHDEKNPEYSEHAEHGEAVRDMIAHHKDVVDAHARDKAEAEATHAKAMNPIKGLADIKKEEYRDTRFSRNLYLGESK